MAVGDIACHASDPAFNGGQGTATACRQQETSDIAGQLDPAAVLMLGDAQYPAGRLSEFRASYDLSWGDHLDITRPVPGNHEYQISGARGYYDYFGARAGNRTEGWYSFDIGDWHVVALNSNCNKVGGCGYGTVQERWLRADLAASTADCTLAIWHHALYASGGGSTITRALWRALDEGGADVVLGGHHHRYERFALQDAFGNLDPNGMRQFVVGTGGKGLDQPSAPGPHVEVQNSDTFGVLSMDLRDGAYDWEFHPVSGSTFTDSGTASCGS